MNENNRRCQNLMERLGLKPRIVTHEPILNYETAEKVDKQLGLTGVETKTLFLKGKSGKYYLFITLASERMDAKIIKKMVGEKVGMVGGDEMIELTGMQPGCMTPFGLKEGLIELVIVDPKLDNEEKLILAFGSETMSVEMTPQDLKTALNSEYEQVIELAEE